MPAKKPASAKPGTTKAAKSKADALTVVKPNVVSAKEAKPKASATKKVTKSATNTNLTKPKRTDVFVSYSHLDKKWLSDLQTHLKPLGREHGITIWDDTRLQCGDRWKEEIIKALRKAKVAILLVSPRFMGSAFIATDELPPLLQAANEEGLIILSVIAGRTGAFNGHAISAYQAVNDPSAPLNLMSEGQIDEVFSQLYSRIYSIFVNPPSNTPRRAASAIFKSIPAKSQKQPAQPGLSPVAVVKPPAKPKTGKVTSTGQRTNSALLVKRTGEWLLVPVSQGTVSTEISLDLQLTTATQRTFVASLRQNETLGSIVFQLQTYNCKVLDVQMRTVGTKETWHLNAAIQPFNRRAEVTYGPITPDKQAETRARLLLLDELPVNDISPFGFLSSVNHLNSGKSPLPDLYQQLNKQPTAFKQTAPLVIAWFLQTHNIVDTIHTLKFTLKGDQLTIGFEGERSSQYQNEGPITIKVQGVCDLSKFDSEKTLKLGPLSR